MASTDKLSVVTTIWFACSLTSNKVPRKDCLYPKVIFSSEPEGGTSGKQLLTHCTASSISNFPVNFKIDAGSFSNYFSLSCIRVCKFRALTGISSGTAIFSLRGKINAVINPFLPSVVLIFILTRF